MIGSPRLQFFLLTGGSMLSALISRFLLPNAFAHHLFTVWSIPLGWFLEPVRAVAAFAVFALSYAALNLDRGLPVDLAIETFEALLVLGAVSWIRGLNRKLLRDRTYYNLLEENVYSMFAATPVGFAIINEHGSFDFVNPFFCRMFGYKASELTGRSYEAIVPPEKIGEFREFHRKVIEGLNELTGEWTVLKNGGETITILSRSIRIIGKDGRPKRASFVIDITDRKRTEDQMAYLATFPEQNPDPVIEFTSEKDIVYSNSAARERFPDLGDNPDHPFLSNLDPILFLLKEYDQKRAVREIRINGRYYIQTFAQVTNGTNVRVYSHDITDFRRAQDEMRKLSIAIQQTSNAVIVTDIQGNIEFVNPSFEKITGYSKDETLGKNPRILKSEMYSRSHYKRMWETLASGEPWFGEFHNRKKDGSYYWAEAHITPIKNSEGRIVSYLGIQEDVTERKRMLEALKLSREEAERANRLKGEFLATVSHEIRTPMNAIIGFTSLLSEEETDPDKQEKLKIINQATQRLLDLINDILDYSKIEAGKLKLDVSRFDVSDLVDSLHLLFSPKAEEKGLEFRVRKSGDFPAEILGDEHKTSQVIQNLLSNAIKFTSRGSVVVDCSRESDFVRIDVTDTGIGIPAKRLESIFLPFEQASSSTNRKYGGSGLGLTISANLASLMGGDLTVKSAEGEGSTFTFRFPVKAEPKASGPGESPHPTEGADIKLRHLHIRALVAAADERGRFLLKDLLEENGIACDCVAGEGEMLKRLEGSKYDLLIIDDSPASVEDARIVERIRSRSAWNDLVIVSTSAGADFLLRKPCEASEFRETMESAVEKIRAIRETRDDDGTPDSIDIIAALRENLSIFSPRRLLSVAEAVEKRQKNAADRGMAERLKAAAAQFDFEALESIISALEKENHD